MEFFFWCAKNESESGLVGWWRERPTVAKTSYCVGKLTLRTFYSILEKIKVWRERPTVTKLNIAVPVTKLPQRGFVFLSFFLCF